MRVFFIALLAIYSNTVMAGWYTGNVNYIGVGYDGATITIRVEGWSRSDCTCYSTWPSHMCLDNSRATSDFEKSLILSAKARQTPIKVHIEESTCKISAISEDS